MTPQDLIAAFDTFSEAPNAGDHLRELILRLAVRGKLVPQDPDDEPADALLLRMATERTRLIAEKRIAEHRDLPAVTAEAQWLELPVGWAWTRLLYVGDWGAGATPRKSETRYFGGTHNWFKSGELPDGPMEQPSAERITDVALRECSLRENQPGDVLIAMYGATIGKLGLLLVPGTTNQAVCACTCFQDFFNRYLFLFLRAWRTEFIDSGEGGAQPNISKIKIVSTPVPVPPLAEQHRIVERVDELMGLLDRLEAARYAREATRAALRDSALAALQQADTHAEVETAWQRIADNIHDLFTNSDDIEPLRQTILQLAVRGRLVPQDLDDEPASELLGRITREKGEFARRKGLRKPKVLPAVGDDEAWFNPPVGWTWCRVQDVVTILDPNPSHRYPQYVPKGVPLLSTREFRGMESWDTSTAEKSVPESFWAFQRELCEFSRTDVVFARKGRLGLARTVPQSGKYTFSHTLFIVKVHADSDSRCLLWFLRPESVVDWLLKEMNANTGVPTLGKAVLERMPFPLPPVAEQRRIVSQVDGIMDILRRLMDSLRRQRDTSDAFAAAAVHHLET